MSIAIGISLNYTPISKSRRMFIINEFFAGDAL